LFFRLSHRKNSFIGELLKLICNYSGYPFFTQVSMIKLLTIVSISVIITYMSKLVEKFSTEHLPQSEDAIAKRKRALKAVGTVVLSLSIIGTAAGVIELGLNAADHQAQHLQEINDSNNYEQLVHKQPVDHSVELPTLPSPENS